MVNARSRRGFTLLELILVIIVIGILATLAIPKFADMAEKARGAEAVNTLGIIKTAEDMYKLETGGYTNTIGYLDITVPTSGHVTFWTYDVLTGATSSYTLKAFRTSKAGGTQSDWIGLNWNDASGATWTGSGHPGQPKNY